MRILSLYLLLGFPKHYRNAYVRYCDAMRPKAAEENPSMDPVALTKYVAERWYKESKEEKNPFVEEAKLDKARFEDEIKAYKIIHPDYESPHKGKKKKKKDHSTENVESSETNAKNGEGSQKDLMKMTNHATDAAKHNSNELPIFTDTFLSHNAQIETELRQLRKQSNETEIQNDFLQKFVENMQGAVSKISEDLTVEKQFSSNLLVYLTKLKCILGSSFNSFALPNMNGASVENIEQFLALLVDPSTPPSTLNKAKDIIKKTEIKI